MKISYEHLLKLMVDKPHINDLSNKLFQLGHEHEINGYIFDFEFTPNRGDCLSLLGLARELNVFYRTNISRKIYNKDIPFLDLNFINKAKEKCPQISFLNIEIQGQISKYKDYLENYFIDLNLNKNNFFTDISNYIAYEMGQPTHSYDFTLLDEDITLKENIEDAQFTTLLGKTINIKPNDLIFTSKDKIINLSGVMGGKNTACNTDTKNTLIECAYFKPNSIIGRGVKYNLHSDALHKFERGTDPNCHEIALRRFIQIVEDHADIIKLGLYTYSKTNPQEVELEFNIDRVNKILGTNVSNEAYQNSLTKLGFKISDSIKVPSYRSDINHQNDLAEELARVIGYDNIPIKSIGLKSLSNEVNQSTEDKIKHFLINNGFSEVINSPFCSVTNSNSIKVDNPLDSNRENIRTNLTDSLIENLIYNEKRQNDSIKLFEISDIYKLKQEKEEKKLAVIISGRRGQNYIDFSQKLDDKYLIKIFKEININIEKYLKKVDRNKINSKIKTPIFLIELNIEDVELDFNSYSYVSKTKNSFIEYKAISEFPTSYRDLSFSVKDPSKISEVISILSKIKSNLIKKSFMFDLYKNKKTNESKIGYRFIFQSYEETLTDLEVDNEIKKIIKSALSVKSVSLPGSL